MLYNYYCSSSSSSSSIDPDCSSNHIDFTIDRSAHHSTSILYGKNIVH